MLRCASVVVIVSTNSSLIKCDGVFISCCLRFLVPFKFSSFTNIEFNLLFPVLSGKNELYLEGVESTVSGYTLT